MQVHSLHLGQVLVREVGTTSRLNIHRLVEIFGLFENFVFSLGKKEPLEEGKDVLDRRAHADPKAASPGRRGGLFILVITAGT